MIYKLFFDMIDIDPRSAREKLITHNLRLVVYISKKFESINNVDIKQIEEKK